MYVRALIVVLAILNAGVALWWATRAPVSPPPPPEAPAGVATLQMLLTPPPAAPAPEAAAAAAPAAAQVASATQPAAPAAADRCLTLGPFPDQAAAEAARSAAGDALRATRVREVTESSSFRVMLNGVGDRAAAQAEVARIKAAGLSDYYVVANGAQNDIALGQYRNREGAERRQAELAAAGVHAEVVASGSGNGTRWWIDGRTRADNAALHALKLPAPRSLDCATLR